MKNVIRIFLIFFLLFALAGMCCVGIGFSLGDNFRDVSAVSGEIQQSFWANDIVRRIARFSFGLWMPEQEADCASFLDVNNLYIYASGTVEILKWDGETIDVESQGKAAWMDELTGTLTIRDKENGWLYNDPVTKISIPSGYLLDELKLHETELVIGDALRADTVIIDENIADVTIESLLHARMKLEVNVNGGNVAIKKAAYTPAAELDSNAGNIHVTFEGKRSDYNISTHSRLGNITVEGAQVDDNLAYGPGQIKANSNTGNIDIGFTQ